MSETLQSYYDWQASYHSERAAEEARADRREERILSRCWRRGLYYWPRDFRLPLEGDDFEE